LIHSSVVIGVEAHQDIWIGLFRQLGQHAVQNTWTQLGRSTRRFDHRGQANWTHRQTPCERGGLSCGNRRKQPRRARECNHDRKYSRAHAATAAMCATSPHAASVFTWTAKPPPAAQKAPPFTFPARSSSIWATRPRTPHKEE
jgi:hypothetical protein